MGGKFLLWLLMGGLAISGIESGRGDLGFGNPAASLDGLTGGGASNHSPSVWAGTSGANGNDYDVQDGQGFGFNLPSGGGDTIDWGPNGYHFKIEYEGEDTVLLADVREADAQSGEFMAGWDETAANLERLAGENLGGELLTFGPAERIEGDFPLYGFSYSAARAGKTFCTAVFYCFGTDYTAEFAAIGPDADTVYLIAGQAAQSYGEPGGQAHMIGYRPQEIGTGQWDYPYLHNPFATTCYYMDLEAPSAERQLTDYEIIWKDGTVEALVRALAEKPEGPVMSSDLDRFISLSITYNEGTDEYTISGNELGTTFPAEGLTVSSLEDLPEFKNVKTLTLYLPVLEDFTPLSSMTGLQYLMILTSSGTADLEWLAPLENLVYLRLGGRYPQVADIGVFARLKHMERIDVRLPGVRDISVFAQMSSLEELTLVCDEEADTEALRDLKQIRRLNINGEEVRWEYAQ